MYIGSQMSRTAPRVCTLLTAAY